MPDAYDLVLEFSRSENAGQPHAFRFAPQHYLLRTPGGGFESAEFPWTPELLADLAEARAPGRAPETIHRIGETLRAFLAAAGWVQHEAAIVRAAREGAPIFITIRSAAAELYALPWEFVALKSTGQLLGGIPGLVVRYEWPEAPSFPDRAQGTRVGRVLFAWSAAGGAVPAEGHLAALTAAFAGLPAAFDPARDVVAHASYAGLAEALGRAAEVGPPIDALHLLCHGAALGQSYGLALDDAAGPGSAVVVDAGRMQQLLAPHAGMVRVVVLAACDSGNSGAPGNHLGSVAQMIHRAGVRAMIASRFPLSAAGSTRLAAALFASLARGETLEGAFLDARDALLRDPSQLDWASVQLYSRPADGDATRPLALPGVAPPAPVSVMPVPVPVPAASKVWARVGVASALAALGLGAFFYLNGSFSGTPEPDAPEEPVTEVEETKEGPPKRAPKKSLDSGAAHKAPESDPGTEPEPVPPASHEPSTRPVVDPTPKVIPRHIPNLQPSPERSLVKCSKAFVAYLGNVLERGEAPTKTLKVEVLVTAEGRIQIETSDPLAADAVVAPLRRLTKKDLTAKSGGELPCTTTLTRFP